MHQVRASGNFNIPAKRRRGQFLAEPGRVSIGAETVPFAAQDRNRSADHRRIVGKSSGLGIKDVLKRSTGCFHRGRMMPSASGIDVEVSVAPVSEMIGIENRLRALRHIGDEAIPLILDRDQPSGRQLR